MVLEPIGTGLGTWGPLCGDIPDVKAVWRCDMAINPVGHTVRQVW